METPILRNNIFNPLKHIPLTLWVVFFCYSICAALIFQKLLLPLVPSEHAGGGLLFNDAVYFDSLAWDIAQWVQSHGWGSFELFAVSGHVTILSALYIIFGHDPALIIPVNAAVHALGGLLIFLLARELSGKEPLGTYAGILAASLFVIFPSALSWFGQLHKDSYVIAGMLLILFTWMKAIRRSADAGGWITLMIGQLAGVFLIASFRCYNVLILIAVTSGLCLVIVIAGILRRQLRRASVLLLFFLMGMVLFGSMYTLIVHEKARQKEIGIQNALKGIKNSPYVYASSLVTTFDSHMNWQSDSWQWQNTPWLPDSIEKYFERAAKTRTRLIAYGLSIKAQSMIDTDINPDNIMEIIEYLPRSLQVAAFAPFPSSWLVNIKITRIVAAGEMFIYYLCFPGILFLLWYHRRAEVWLSLYFSCFFLLVLGFTTANLGTLYRLRYGFFFILLLMGVLGWLTLMDKFGCFKRVNHRPKPSDPCNQSIETHPMDNPPARKQVLGRGFGVMFLTFLCFLGFFLRDLLQAKTLGLGASLDYFFIALMIPMFLVTVLYMPLGAAFVPIYLAEKEKLLPQALRDMVSVVSSWTGVSLLMACLVLYLCEPFLLSHIAAKGSLLNMEQLTPLLNLALSLLLFSGLVILGNSILNADGKASLASGAQLIVPAVAIMSLLLFGERWGVRSVMYGMVVGQILNLFIVQYWLSREKIWVLPRLNFKYRANLTPILKQYWPLMVSALFISLVLPVSTMLAMSLTEGSVSAFNLGTKVVLFITGLVDTAILAVMLPYFSLLVAKNRLLSVKQELSFFLLLATFISVPISAGLFLWSEQIVRIIFEGGSFGSNATEQVTRVMQYSLVQLPFFICNSLMLKFAMANRRVITISAVAFVGLMVNIVAGILLMKHMGVGGIALGASLSVLVSTILLLLVLFRNSYVTGLDAVFMMVSWMLFITLLMCIHFRSIPSIYMTIFAYVLLMGGYVRSLKFAKSH